MKRFRNSLISLGPLTNQRQLRPSRSLRRFGPARYRTRGALRPLVQRYFLARLRRHRVGRSPTMGRHPRTRWETRCSPAIVDRIARDRARRTAVRRRQDAFGERAQLVVRTGAEDSAQPFVLRRELVGVSRRATLEPAGECARRDVYCTHDLARGLPARRKRAAPGHRRRARRTARADPRRAARRCAAPVRGNGALGTKPRCGAALDRRSGACRDAERGARRRR